MVKIDGLFVLMHQDSQEFGSNDENMVSRVFFLLAIDGKPIAEPNGSPRQFHADVKLPVGGNYVQDELEVGRPVGYRGPFDHEAFAKSVTAYVRTCVGPGAMGISFAPGSSVRMRDNRFGFQMPFAFSAVGDPARTW